MVVRLCRGRCLFFLFFLPTSSLSLCFFLVRLEEGANRGEIFRVSIRLVCSVRGIKPDLVRTVQLLARLTGNQWALSNRVPRDRGEETGRGCGQQRIVCFLRWESDYRLLATLHRLAAASWKSDARFSTGLINRRYAALTVDRGLRLVNRDRPLIQTLAASAV